MASGQTSPLSVASLLSILIILWDPLGTLIHISCLPFRHSSRQVQLIRLWSLQSPGDLSSAPVSPSASYIVDVRTRVPEGRHVEGAKALGLFGLCLGHLVSLRKATNQLQQAS